MADGYERAYHRLLSVERTSPTGHLFHNIYAITPTALPIAPSLLAAHADAVIVPDIGLSNVGVLPLVAELLPPVPGVALS